jgi:hypothetical protein
MLVPEGKCNALARFFGDHSRVTLCRRREIGQDELIREATFSTPLWRTSFEAPSKFVIVGVSGGMESPEN